MSQKDVIAGLAKSDVVSHNREANLAFKSSTIRNLEVNEPHMQFCKQNLLSAIPHL